MNEDDKSHAGTGLRIFQNFGYLTVGKLLADGATFWFFIVLARTYGQEGIGQYSFAMALTSVLAVFADFGIHNLSIKYLSRDRDQVTNYYGRLLAVRLLLSATVISVLLVMTALFPFPEEMKLLIIVIGAYQVFLTLVDGFGAVFVAWEDMHITSLLEVSLRVTTALAGIVIVYSGGGLILAVSVLPVMTILHVALGYHLTLKRCGALHIAITVAEARQILCEAFPYAIHFLLELFSSRVTLLFVGFMLGVSATGLFNAAYRLIVVLLWVPIFAGYAVFPVASRLHISSPKQLQGLHENTLNFAIIIGLPMSAGIWLIAPKLIELFYGIEFFESIGILRWLAWLVVLGFLKTIMQIFLTACDRQMTVTRIQFLVACIGSILHYWLIAKFGLQGAAAAILLTEILLIVILGSRANELFNWKSIAKRVVMSSTAVAAFLVLLMVWNEFPLPVTILSSVLVYCGVLLLFHDIRQNELRLFLDYLPYNRHNQSDSSKKPVTKTGKI
ncbi:MAG: peptide-binding protein [Nitrospirales bacterium]|nr:MAG: peptide-binding protein [Nitrospirales bacterium]